EEDAVAHVHFKRHEIAVIFDPALPDQENLALLGLLLGGVRDDQARCGGLLSLERLDDDPILERLDFDRHCRPSFFAHIQTGLLVRHTPSRGSYAAKTVSTLLPRVLTPNLALGQ